VKPVLSVVKGVKLPPGCRVIDGKVYYSAAWL